MYFSRTNLTVVIITWHGATQPGSQALLCPTPWWLFLQLSASHPIPALRIMVGKRDIFRGGRMGWWVISCFATPVMGEFVCMQNTDLHKDMHLHKVTFTCQK